MVLKELPEKSLEPLGIGQDLDVLVVVQRSGDILGTYLEPLGWQNS